MTNIPPTTRTNGAPSTVPCSQVPVPKVSVIIVNWNGRQYLQECLESLDAQTFRDFEVVLVDNGSVDGSVIFVQETFPWVKVVALPGNSGFAGGNNAGYAAAAGDYLVTLNNDTRVDPVWLAELVAVADAAPRAGMVASRICSHADPDLIDSLGVKICPDGMSRGAMRLRRYSELDLAEVEPILLPSACAALYKRAMLIETGFFDEDFFAYCEDTDLGLRGRLAGWEALLASRAVVLHKYSRTGGTFSPFKLYLVERNHYWAAMKSFPPGLLLLLPYFTFCRYLAQARLVLSARGSGGEFVKSASKSACIMAIIKGLLHAIAGLPLMLGKRAGIMGKARLSGREMTGLLRQYRLGFRELLDD